MLNKIDELRLIARCVAFDDHRAFRRLVEEFSPGLRRFVFNLTLGDASLTDDISQNTFLKAYTSLRSFKGISRFSTWLYTIACHEYADYMRSRREIVVDDINAIAERSHDDSIRSEISHDLTAALQQLNEHERMAVLLFYLEDRPLKDVCRITGRPEGTVKATLSRARKKLAEIITDYR